MLLCACILTWMGWSSSPQEALALCLSRRGLSESVMCPSQLRYLQYFESLLQNVRPSADALLLTSLTVSALPDILSYITKNGLTLVTVSQNLGE